MIFPGLGRRLVRYWSESMTVDMDRRRVLGVLASVPIVPGAVASLLAACSGKKKAGDQNASGSTEVKPFGDVEPEQIPWKDMYRGYDMMDRINFASLKNEGLLIDLGTSDFFKYTLGQWRTGWGRSFVRDGVGYTHIVGVTTRLFFPWDKSEDLVIRFRAKPFAGTFFSLYLNEQAIQRVDLKSAQWETYSVSVPAKNVKAGENYMKFRWDRTENVAGEDLAAAMDYIHIVPATASDVGGVLPTHSTVVGKARAGKDEAPALLLASGMTLTYWLRVPEGQPMLGMNLGILPPAGGVAAPDMSVTAVAFTDGVPASELISHSCQGAEAGTFSPRAADLSGMAGKVVRLDVSVDASAATDARVALVQPGIYVMPPATVDARPAKAARNVVVVMIDTLRADHTAPYSKTRVQTPVFDKVARDGALFERFSAVEDWTKPSCATMLTGLYPDTHKAQKEESKLSSSIPMISEMLKKQGIATGAFIANGYVSGKFGFERGWDEYTNYIRESKATSAQHVFGDAAAWIEANKDRRFYAYVHTIDPHVPYSPPDEFLQMYDKEPYSGPIVPRQTHLQLEDIKKDKIVLSDRDKERIVALYDGEISYHDKWFGGFLQKLSDLGLIEDTMIIVVSDHGEEFWDHGGVGHGHQIHQELIHVPFVVMWKGTIPPEQRIGDNHDHSCLVPTIFDALQISTPSHLEGRSILPRAMGRHEDGPHAGFSTHQGDREAAWSGRHKLIKLGPVNTFLYDVVDDPGCKKDLDKDLPITLTYMQAMLGQFLGAPSKSDWRSSTLGEKSALEIEDEKVEMDEELEQQLKALGYVQ